MEKVQHYEILNIIGKGSFGNVYLSRDIQTNKNYAAKQILKSQFKNKTLLDYFTNEVTLLKQLNHENIVGFKDVIEKDGEIYLFTEYCNGGSLENILRFHLYNLNSPIPEKIVKYFIKNILQGIAYLNENNIIHRDIKSNNILLKYEKENDMITRNYENAKIKIIDFGFAKILNNGNFAKSLVGSPMYMDPTILKSLISENKNEDNVYDQKIDVWSLGILTYELLIGNLPFNGKNLKELYTNIDSREFIINRNLIKDLCLTEAAIKFIDTTLNVDVNKRRLPVELLNDPWIMNNNETNKLYKLRKNLPKNKICFINYWEPKNKGDRIGEKLVHLNHKKNIKSIVVNNSILKENFYPISSIGNTFTSSSENKFYFKTNTSFTLNNSSKGIKTFNHSDEALDSILTHHYKTFQRHSKFAFNKKLKLKPKKAETNKNIQRIRNFRKVLDRIRLSSNNTKEESEEKYKNYNQVKNSNQVSLLKNKKTFCADSKFLIKKININLYYINNSEETKDKSIGKNYSLPSNSGNNIKKINDRNCFRVKNFKFCTGTKEKNHINKKNRKNLNLSCGKFNLIKRPSFYNLS